jgi:hypothetical protein
VIPGFRPESALERQLLADVQLREGLSWGAPRPGHPEGSVGHHASRMLTSISPSEPRRSDLRILTLIHDSFKHRVRADEPWSPANDHAAMARRFAERHVRDERLLTALELHDAPYWIWRHGASEDAVAALIAQLPDPDLFTRFVELDASSPGKDPAFLAWFHDVIGRLAPETLAA